MQLDEEPTIVVREPDAATQLAPQNNQLKSQRRILCFKPSLRLERRDHDGQNTTVARSFRQLRRFPHFINADKVFGTHTYTGHACWGAAERNVAQDSPFHKPAIIRTGVQHASQRKMSVANVRSRLEFGHGALDE
jgi:hypothetical protein